ncbi:hypothetical protein FVE85_9750 [Porphyridium purpureum]|uniref:Uncharacterized protein n=1 Tax=Porphyridium purpureum TaxID=35688 RepID=A0A5J4YM19_PORPP|nr:hypothetical protein FVE85_9750 [Porphyridium purpureum]|eukprot:POR3987..scf246_12
MKLATPFSSHGKQAQNRPARTQTPRLSLTRTKPRDSSAFRAVYQTADERCPPQHITRTTRTKTRLPRVPRTTMTRNSYRPRISCARRPHTSAIPSTQRPTPHVSFLLNRNALSAPHRLGAVSVLFLIGSARARARLGSVRSGSLSVPYRFLIGFLWALYELFSSGCSVGSSVG